MSGAGFLDAAVLVALAMLGMAFLLIAVRVVRGPTLPDRIVALDLMVLIGIGFIAAFGVKTGFYLYLDIGIALGLVGFLATVALARYLLRPGGPTEGDESDDPGERREQRKREEEAER